jgi:hypothetical protein
MLLTQQTGVYQEKSLRRGEVRGGLQEKERKTEGARAPDRQGQLYGSRKLVRGHFKLQQSF